MADPCTACGKPAARIDALRADEGWECAHVDCPSRRRCWSEGVHAPRREAVLPMDSGLGELFDSPLAPLAEGASGALPGAAGQVISMATRCEGMPAVSAAGAGALNPNRKRGFA